MNRPAALEPQNRWLLCATAGLGLCLASTEYERYTALWVFGTRTPEELAFIMLALAAALALGVAVAAGSKARLSSKGWLLAVLALVQTAGLVVRARQAFGEGASSELATASSVCLQAAGLLFVLYAEFFLEVGVRKAIRAFALALAVAGALQIACAMAPSGLALGAAFFFMPGACALLALGDRLRGTPETSSEQEDITAEREQSEGFSQAFPFWECCASIALINVLLLSLHDQAMALQDSGQASRAIQVSAGIASVASGALFFSLLNHLQEMEFVELFRTLVLPLVVVALYVSALFDDSVPALYLVPLGICYSVLLLFVWTVPRYYRPERMPFAYTCIAFFAYKLGWALGICGIMLAPAAFGSDVRTVIILLAFFALLLLAALHIVRLWRLRAHDVQRVRQQADMQASAEALFADACARVAARYGLTPRESEVLVLLARGRNARHIAESLVISDGTARTHIMHIYQKMEINSQQSLMDRVEEAARTE